ncbi:MAG: hypothetical protein COT43_06615 [Candidatus Marinimicrobia bacterium CG08_land_8_20_14_0_20_45_22]|nr:MAG: hypothetical protein COT43_06615 [Candidatus Marinimicrobia bacterium CG08_land_8_20_14_0_20_45_22]
MSKQLDYSFQDASVLATTTRRHFDQLAAYKIDEAFVADFEAKAGTLRAKEVAYNDASNDYDQKTAVQRVQIARALKVVARYKKASHVIFLDDAVTRKEFGVGEKGTKSVKTLTTQLSHLKSVVDQRKEAVLNAGIKQEEIDEIGACLTDLIAADSAQEDALRLRTTLYDEVMAGLKELENIKRKIRKTADLCFMDNKSVLAEFRSVVPPYKAKTTTTTTETGTNP